jgi:hypothetical protein
MKSFLYRAVLITVFTGSLLAVISCVSGISNKIYIYESFWTLNGLIAAAVISSIIALSAGAAIIRSYCVKNNKIQ